MRVDKWEGHRWLRARMQGHEHACILGYARARAHVYIDLGVVHARTGDLTCPIGWHTDGVCTLAYGGD